MSIEILPYNPDWPDQFREIAASLRGALEELALRIDHIGSTSVPDLAGKDIIDVQITVTALDEPVLAALVESGYTKISRIHSDHVPPRGPADAAEWAKWFFSPPAGRRTTNVHVRVLGRANQRYPLLFRDYLRTHPATAVAYAELKRRLAHNLPDPDTYPDVKDPAVDLIYLAAEDWAESVGWRPGPSDG